MTDKNNFFVVGIGASAGGLQALQAFFSALPDQNPAAFVVIQHLSPDFKSMMDELLAKYTKMTIIKVTKPVQVQPNHVYVMSPKRNLELVNGSLTPVPPDAYEKPNLPIDLFFKSLGREWRNNSVGIILTGTGTDGSRGINAIKEQGGIVMAQNPNSAKFDGMPNAAVHTGLTDFVLELPQLAQETQRVINRLPRFSENGDTLSFTDRGHLAHILNLIAKKTRLDFSFYKEATILRRIQKRMHIVNADILEDYYNILLSNAAEVEQLGNEILIGVSSFFRDGKPWKAFQEKVMPALAQKIRDGDSLRVWVAGCSTGEEAYTIGMIIDDYLAKHQLKPDYKIFGSDIDKRAIQTAGLGVYSHSIADSIPEEYLAYYFSRSAKTYRVKKFFRDHFVFASHNIISDPPFIRMDVVSCRNVLIYFNNDVQQKVMSHFHFSLSQDGFLILGKSESIGHLQRFFTTPLKNVNIFQNQVASSGKQLSVAPRELNTEPGGQYATGIRKSAPLTTVAIKTMIADSYDEAGVLVNADCYILYTLGNVVNYFHFPKKDLRMHLEDVMDTDEYLLVKSGVREALKDKKAVYHQDVLFVKGRSKHVVTLRFKSLSSSFFDKEVVYIEFQNPRKPDQNDKKIISQSKNTDRRVALLEKEVDEKQRLLQTLREELDTHSEELQTTNEELLASNEELQSSNEELQSVNEELYSLNSELEDKIKEVTEANNDVVNLFNSTQIATVFIDQDLKIRRMTSNISNIININDKDIGRSLEHFTTNLVDISLVDLARQATSDGNIVEQEVSIHFNDRYYLMRMLPYYEAEGKANGLVITFVDITEKERSRQQMKEIAERLNLVLHSSNVGTWEYDLQTEEVKGDSRLYELFDLPEGKLKFEQIVSRIHPEDYPQVSDALDQAIKKNQMYKTEFRVVRSNGEITHLIGQGSLVDSKGEKSHKILGINLDITKQKQNEEDKIQYGKLLEESYNEIYIFDAQSLNFINVNQGALYNLGYSMPEMQQLTPIDLKDEFTAESFSDLITPLRNGEEEVLTYETTHKRKDGSHYDVLVNLQLSTFRHQKIFVAIVQDITIINQAYEQLRQSEERLAFAISGTSDGIWDWEDMQKDSAWWSPRLYDLLGYEDGEIETNNKSFQAISHPDDVDAWQPVLEKHLKEGTPYDVTMRLKHKIKGYRWFRSRGKAIYNNQGQPVRLSGVISDVHDQKTAERKLKKSNRELRVANEYLDNFVFTAAHDLRAPVANLKSLSSLLESENGHDSRVVKKINQSLNRLENTLQGIIRILDIQQSDDEEYQLLRFDEALATARDEIELEIEFTDVTIERDFAVKTVQYVEYYLVTILKNLLTNAIKYHAEGRPPHIHIRTKKTDGYILLEIQDNGAGFDVERYGNIIFKPFKRVNPSGNGSGVGLHIVKTIVEKNGGKIEVQSQLDKGTIFFVYLMPYPDVEKNTSD
ncbi:MAG: chemotaxis protein CheB [Bacteroidota bacterium]